MCNGIGQRVVTAWDPSIPAAIKSFQNRYKIPQTGKFDPTTWMSLLTSKGDPNRPCVACDARFEITDELAKYLKADGYQIVGRYLSEPNQSSKKEADYFKAIRTGELDRIVKHGLKYFPIFQEYSTKITHFTPESGARHAREATVAAQRLGVPGTVIYFAVDFDATDPQGTSNILPYFQAIKSNLGGGYGVGIYASRNICTRVVEAGYAVASFVSDMSTGFSGNLGFPIPNNWVLDQFHEIRGYRGKWDLDRVAYSGRISACATVLTQMPVPAPDPDPATPIEINGFVVEVNVSMQDLEHAIFFYGHLETPHQRTPNAMVTLRHHDESGSFFHSFLTNDAAEKYWIYQNLASGFRKRVKFRDWDSSPSFIPPR